MRRRQRRHCTTATTSFAKPSCWPSPKTITCFTGRNSRRRSLQLHQQGIYVTGFRDPCLWQEGDDWYLGIGSGERTIGGCVLLYRSRDLRHWEYLHKLVQGKPNGKVAVNPCDSGEMWECPDFFAVSGRHCLFYSTEDKVIWTTGEYDALHHRYVPMRTGVLDHGSSYYAPKSFLAPDGRRILWGWIRETRPEAQYAAAGWAGVMSLPRVFTVNQYGELEMNPAIEVEKLRGAENTSTLQVGTQHKQTLTSLRREFYISLGDAQSRILRASPHREQNCLGARC